MVAPASALVSEYLEPVTFVGAQFAPPASQRSQVYVWVMGAVPLQPPADAVRRKPTRVVPETVGAVVLRGAVARDEGWTGAGCVFPPGPNPAQAPPDESAKSPALRSE